MKAFNKIFAALTLGGAMAFSGLTFAQDAAEAPAEPQVDPRAEAAENLNQLLQFVKQGQTTEARENKASFEGSRSGARATRAFEHAA
jgi:biopolymer transport protein ExbB